MGAIFGIVSCSPVLITRSIKQRIDVKALTLHPNQLPQTILSPSVLDCGSKAPGFLA